MSNCLHCDECGKVAWGFHGFIKNGRRLWRCDDCQMHHFGEPEDLNPDHCQECREAVEYSKKEAHHAA